MKAGLFLVKNNITEKTFIVSVNGTEPFLRISNIIYNNLHICFNIYMLL